MISFQCFDKVVLIVLDYGIAVRDSKMTIEVVDFVLVKADGFNKGIELVKDTACSSVIDLGGSSAK